MQRKTSAVPSHILSFRCGEPTLNRDLLHEHLFEGNRLYNKLIEIERARRFRYRDFVDSLHPEYVVAKAELSAVRKERHEARNELNELRQASQTRVRHPELQERIKTLGKRVTAAEAVRNEIRAAISEEPQIKAESERIDEEAVETEKAARAESAIHWGTKAFATEAVKAAAKGKSDPEFRRFRNAGRVGCQIQDKVTTRDVFLGVNKFVQIDPLPEDQWNTRPGRRHASTKVRIRAGSTGAGNRIPVWIELPVMLHRRLPEGVITWAWINVELIGLEYVYHLQIVLESEEFARLHEGDRRRVDMADGRRFEGKVVSDKKGSMELLFRDKDGLQKVKLLKDDIAGSERIMSDAVAVDLCWRTCPEGLLVATAVDGKGNIRRLIVPDGPGGNRDPKTGRRAQYGIRRSLEHSSELRSASDKLFNEAIEVLLNLRKRGALPDWAMEETSHAHQWRSHKSLARLARRLAREAVGEQALLGAWDRWKGERLSARLDLFAPFKEVSRWCDGAGIRPKDRPAVFLEWWRRKNRHLYQWETMERVRAIRHRKDMYRKWVASTIRPDYEQVIVQKVNLVSRNPDPENPGIGPGLHPMQRAAALSVLRAALQDMAVPVEKVELKECPYCASVAEKDSTHLVCGKCVVRMDVSVARCWHMLMRCGLDVTGLRKFWKQQITGSREFVRAAAGNMPQLQV